jgi:endoglucanase
MPGRGINLGGALDGAGAARGALLDRHLDIVREAGFDTVRLPVKWTAHQAAAPPHAVAVAFLDRVDRAVGAALRRGLHVVLDVHHFDELSADPHGEADRFLALWSQIARRYADADPRLTFELLNEPHEPMGAERWNDLLAAALAVVRASNPGRAVLVGPVHWNTIDGLGALRLPADDRLVATIHYYSPFRFTHQGAEWLDGADAWRGTSWGTDAERARVRADLERAAAWAQARGYPLFLGEFGTIAHAGMAARADWTGLVRREAERLGIGWAYWDLATDFGAYDPDRGTWHAPLERALLGDG